MGTWRQDQRGEDTMIDLLDLGHPSPVSIFSEEPGYKLLAALFPSPAQLPLGFFYGRLGLCRGVHVLREDGLREVLPKANERRRVSERLSSLQVRRTV